MEMEPDVAALAEVEADFQRECFQTFRPGAIRLAFIFAFLPVLLFFPHWVTRADQALEMLPIRMVGSVAMLAYPLAMLWGLPRRALPWLLYGPVLLALLIMIWKALPLFGSELEIPFTVCFCLVFIHLVSVPLNLRENIIGSIVILLTTNLFAILWPGLRIMLIRMDLMCLPILVIIIYSQRMYAKLMWENFRYRRTIEAMAHRDPLTGVYNRRYFTEAGARILKQSLRSHFPVSLLMVDIDHFKKINDAHGHPTGDVAIKETARLILCCLRDSDLFARIGGEEFAVLLPGADRNEGALVAERIRESIASLELTCDGLAHPLHFTVSLGLTHAIGGGESLATLLGQADQALYDAKRNGRNRMVCFEQTPS